MTANVERTGFEVDADVNPFRAAMVRLAEGARTGQKNVEGILGDFRKPLDMLQSRFAALAGIVAGGAMFKASVNASKEFTGEAVKLSRALNINTTEASTLNIALGDIYSSADQFVDASAKLGRQLLKNEDELNRVGLVTRDSSGHFRNMQDLMLDSIKVLNSYEQGVDRNLAALSLFGKGAGEVTSLLKLNSDVIEEARKKQEDLALVVGVENVAAARAYKAAVNDVEDVLLAVKKAVGDAVMPVFTQLGQWFASVGPAAVVVVKGAIAGLAATFWGLKNAVETVWNVIAGFVESVTVGLVGIGTGFAKILTGDLQGGVAAFRGLTESMRAIWAERTANILASARDTQERLWQLFAAPTSTTNNQSGRRFVERPEKPQAAAAAKEEPSRMREYELQLEERKLAFEREQTMRDFNKQQELAYWREVLEAADVTSKDRVAVQLKAARLEVAILREKARDAREIESLRREDQHLDALYRINELQAQAQQERDLGLINEAAYLARERQFNQMRLQEELDFIAKKIEIAKLDPEKNVVLLEQLEQQKNEIRRRYAAEAADIGRRAQLEQAQPMTSIVQSISDGFGVLTQKLLTDWRNLGSALKGVLTSIGSTIIQEVVVKPIQKRIMLWAQERALALSGIGADAAKAASGAAASQASIPIVGPMLALAAMGAIMTAVGGLKSKVPSAEGGWSVPSGINPLTQLHEEEMVLPKDIANPLRQNLAAGQGMGGKGDTFVIQAMDSRSLERFLMDNAEALGAGIRHAALRGVRLNT